MAGKYKGQGSVTEVYDVTSLGSGLDLKRSRKGEFTHKEALKLLENCTEFVGDRKLKQNHVDFLVRQMLRSTFHAEWVTVITCSINGTTYRMNGQHTAWARLEMPEDWPCKVDFMEYEAQSMDDMRTLYSSIDRASPRTRANVIESYIAGTEEFMDIKSSTLRVMPSGFTLWMWTTIHERKQYDGDDIAFLLRTDYYDLAMKVCAFLDSVGRRDTDHVFRGPVVGAMFATFNKAPQIAKDFWAPVADGTGIEKKNDPRLRLRNELMKAAVGVGVGAASSKKKVSQEFMLRLCLVAWNAYREDRELRVLRANEKGKRPTAK